MSAPVKEQIKANKPTRELWLIAGSGDLDRLEQTLADGAEVNAGDQSGMTALMRATYHGHLQMVRALIEHGADLNAKDRDGLTSLKLAKHMGHKEIVSALISYGAPEASPTLKQKSPPVESAPEEKVDPLNDVHDEARPSKNPEIRTLHEPQEIWNLVHATEPESKPRSNFAGRLPNFARLHVPRRYVAFAVIVLIVGAGSWFAFTSLRDSGGATDATPVRPDDRAKVTESKTNTSSSGQQRAHPAKRAKVSEPKTIASFDQQPKATGKLTGVRDIDAIPVAARVALSVRKSPAKSPANARAQKSTSSASSNRARNPVRLDAGADGDRRANSTRAKKESIKAPEPQASDPPKSTPPKPKVIQWP